MTQFQEDSLLANQVTKTHQMAKKFDFNNISLDTKQPRNAPPVDHDNLNRQQTKYFGTRNYRSPEIVLLQGYDYKVDMWALGCVMAELLRK